MALNTTPFDPAAYLDTPEAIAAYLQDALEEGTPGEIADALGVVVRAHGLSRIAAETGLSRQALYKTLSPTGNPELATLLKVIGALGIQLSAKVAARIPDVASTVEPLAMNESLDRFRAMFEPRPSDACSFWLVSAEQQIASMNEPIGRLRAIFDTQQAAINYAVRFIGTGTKEKSLAFDLGCETASRAFFEPATYVPAAHVGDCYVVAASCAPTKPPSGASILDRVRALANEADASGEAVIAAWLRNPPPQVHAHSVEKNLFPKGQAKARRSHKRVDVAR